MRTDVTSEEVEELLDELHEGRIFAVLDDVVSVSGGNADCGRVAEKMARTLVNHGIPAGLVHDDGVHAVNFGGVQFTYGKAA